MSETTYEGWTNYETWNVSLWINNTESIYREACQFMKKNPERANPYIGFILTQFMTSMVTADAVEYLSDKLNYKELDEMMKELAE